MIDIIKLVLIKKKGGISLEYPNNLAITLQLLPPILHIFTLKTIQLCSKGS